MNQQQLLATLSVAEQAVAAKIADPRRKAQYVEMRIQHKINMARVRGSK